MLIDYYLILINIFAFILFGIDKQKSIKKEYRIPEKALFIISFLGGAFGSLFGMFFFHHKNRKIKFLILIPICCILWCLIFFI